MRHVIDIGMGKIQDMYLSANMKPGCSSGVGKKCSREEEDELVEAAEAVAKSGAESKCDHLKQELSRTAMMAEKLKQGQDQLQKAQKKMNCEA